MVAGALIAFPERETLRPPRATGGRVAIDGRVCVETSEKGKLLRILKKAQKTDNPEKGNVIIGEKL